MDHTEPSPPKLPPRWFVRLAWRVHRLLNRVTGGGFLWDPTGKRGWGALRLTTTGRRSGQERSVILGYLQDGPNMVTLAMNGWREGHPAWWLNLIEHPEAHVELRGLPRRPVRARMAEGDERERLWGLWTQVNKDMDRYAALRTTPTPVVVFEPS